MKAGIIKVAGKSPVYGDFNEPVAGEGQELITVNASALSQFSKSRSMSSHYSSSGTFPSVAGADGVGRTADGRRVYFVLPEAPYGAFAERTLVRSKQCVAVPGGLDDVTAAAIANPGMSAWAALVERAQMRTKERVLVNGATGTAGRLAVQLAKYLGASKVIAAGRNERELQELRSVGADVLIPFTLGNSHPLGAKYYEQALIAEFVDGIDVVIDYLWGESAKTIIVAIEGGRGYTPCPLRARRRSQSRGKPRTPGRCAPFVRHSVDGQRTEECSVPEAARLDQHCL